MAQSNAFADERLLLASKGYDLKPLKDIDPALRIPRSKRMDAWTNPSTGFGTRAQHPVANSQYTGIPKVDTVQQEDLYQSDWVSRKIIDAPSEDMTRNGISYKHNDDDESKEGEEKEATDQIKIQKEVEDFDDLLNEQFKLWQTAFQSIALARASGGSVTVFNFDDVSGPDDFWEPLNENQVSEIRWVRQVPAWFAIPVTWYQDVNDPKWLQPEHYQVIIREPAGGKTLNVHESRLIRMDGRFTTQTPRTLNRGWDDSELQAVYTALRDYGICVTESNSTMETFTQDYLGMKGLAEKVMTGSDPDYILDRLAMTHFNMTSNRLNVYDADSEKMERKGTPITGLADLWDRYTEAICGAASIPKSRFFSSESGNLGGTSSESDTRTYFNGIHSKQEIQLRPWLNEFMTFVNMAVGMLTELPSYVFNPLQEQSDKDKADTAYTVAQKDEIYVNLNVVSPEEVGISRFSKDTVDLESMIIDFKAREEMKDEFTPEEADAMAEELEGIKMEKAISDEAAKQNQVIPPEIPEKPEEKKDQIIKLEPQIIVEAPIVNVKIPEQIDHAKEIDDIQKGLDEISKKLDQEIEI
jgi:phage-related protein (TIGR01555 family)